MWYLRHTGKVLAGTDDMEMTMGARMALAGVIFLRLIPFTVWTRNMLWRQKINVNLLSKYQLLVRETEQTQLLCLVDNYCEVFLGILSILAVGGISVYLSGENLDHLYMYFVQTLWKEGISKKVLSERSCSLFSPVPTVCTTPPIPPRGRLSISVTIIFDHFYNIITIPLIVSSSS